MSDRTFVALNSLLLLLTGALLGAGITLMVLGDSATGTLLLVASGLIPFVGIALCQYVIYQRGRSL